jgi:hypothetical protein
MRKGIIYCWKVSNEIKYVGRTVQTLEQRSNSHIREYYAQKDNGGLYTNKFIEVEKLPNKWDDVEFYILEDNIAVDVLGEREEYWYNNYNPDKLWNSVKPGSSFLFSLSEEKKFLYKKNVQFKNYVEGEVSRIYHKLSRTFEKEIEHYWLIRTGKNTGKVNHNITISSEELTNMIIMYLEEYRYNRFFPFVLQRVLEDKNLVPSAFTRYGIHILNDVLISTFEEEFENLKSKNFISMIMKDINYKYIDKQTKLEYAKEINLFLKQFDSEFDQLQSKWFSNKNKSLEKLFIKYCNHEFVNTLMTYIRGKNTYTKGHELNLKTNKYQYIDELVREKIFDKYYYHTGRFDEYRIKHIYDFYGSYTRI